MVRAKKLKITILTDDTASSDKFVCEHGLSVFIELLNGHKWLMDTGTSDVFLENAKRLKLDLEGLHGITITHGHDDHTGGLAFYHRIGSHPPVYAHPYIWHKSYQFKDGHPVRVTGIPFHARRNISQYFHPVNDTVELDEGFYILTDIPRRPGSYEPIGGNFFNEDATGPVPFIDDASLAIKTSKGIVVVVGCAHAGYTNILEAVERTFPEDKVLAVIGGLHLLNADEKVFEEAVTVTRRVAAKNFVFYGGHCTGNEAIAYFKKALGEAAVAPLGTGRVIQIKA